MQHTHTTRTHHTQHTQHVHITHNTHTTRTHHTHITHRQHTQQVYITHTTHTSHTEQIYITHNTHHTISHKPQHPYHTHNTLHTHHTQHNTDITQNTHTHTHTHTLLLGMMHMNPSTFTKCLYCVNFSTRLTKDFFGLVGLTPEWAEESPRVVSQYTPPRTTTTIVSSRAGVGSTLRVPRVADMQGDGEAGSW